jgi:hypothetical protein
MNFSWRNSMLAAASLAALCFGGVLIATRTHSLPDPARRFEAHFLPMDYSDENVRAGIDWFLTAKKFRLELEPLRGSCDATQEAYRIEAVPGLSGPDLQVTDLMISGRTARVIRWELQRDAHTPNHAAWKQVASRPVTDEAADLIRQAAIDLLDKKIAFFDNLLFPDADEWSVEICWHGRYHFFERHFLSPEEQAFEVYATRLTELGQATP